VPLRWRKSAKASYLFRLGNVDVDAFVDYFRTHPGQYPEYMDVEWTVEEALAQYDENGTFLFPHGGGMQMELLARAVKSGDLPESLGAYDTLDAMQMHLIRETGVCHVITGFVSNDDLDAEALSRSLQGGRRVAYLFSDCLKKYVPGFEKAFVSATADDLGIRGSRLIVGRSSFSGGMAAASYRCADAIGVGVAWQNKIMHSGKRAWGAQAFTNEAYQIPLSCLLPKGIDNLVIGSGKGADTDPPLMLRAMGLTMAVGQGAGAAAAVAARAGVPVSAVNLADLRAELLRQGVELR
jgi:hypothetical protein